MNSVEHVGWLTFCIIIVFHASSPSVLLTPEEVGVWEEISKVEPEERLSRGELNSLLSSKSSLMKQNNYFPSSIFGLREDCPAPVNFPREIPLTSRKFRNWARNIEADNVWTAIPRTSKEILVLANWAYRNEYTLRPQGFRGSWAPLTVVSSESTCQNTVIIDMSHFLVQMKMISSAGNFRAVQVQTGASMESLLAFIETHKCSLFAAPVVGELTVGGVLAVGSHGSGLSPMVLSPYGKGVPSSSSLPPGYTSGTLSNLILSLKAAVWDHEEGAFIIKKFSRLEPDSIPLLVHLGRAMVTEVTLLVGPSHKLRCESWTDSSARKLFANPEDIHGTEGAYPHHKSFASLIEKYQSVEVSVFPYTDSTMITACSNRSRNPTHQSSKQIFSPYPFTYQENVPRPVTLLLSQFLSGNQNLAPMISRLNHQFHSAGLRLSTTGDIWGSAKDMQLRQRSSSTPSFSSGYAIITKRRNIQRVASEVYTLYEDLLEKFSDIGKHPQNQPLQLTVTGLDESRYIPQLGIFEPPALSVLAPVKGKAFDVAVILSVSVYPGTKGFEKFMRQMESQLLLRYDGDDALVRPEWPKAWAFTDSAAWDNELVIRKVIPKGFYEDWNWVVGKLEEFDPHQVFTNQFLRQLLQVNQTTGMGMTKWW